MITLDIIGTESGHRLDEYFLAPDATVQELHVNSGTRHWAVAYNPKLAVLITATSDPETKAMRYDQYQLPLPASTDTETARRLVERQTQRKQLRRAFHALGSLPLASPAYQDVAGVRRNIIDNPLLLEIDEDDISLRDAAGKWQSTYTRAAEIEDWDITPGLDGLAILLDTYDIVDPSPTKINRVKRLAKMTSDILMALTNRHSKATPAGVTKGVQPLIDLLVQTVEAARDGASPEQAGYMDRLTQGTLTIYEHEQDAFAQSYRPK